MNCAQIRNRNNCVNFVSLYKFLNSLKQNEREKFSQLKSSGLFDCMKLLVQSGSEVTVLVLKIYLYEYPSSPWHQKSNTTSNGKLL